jgi:transposase
MAQINGETTLQQRLEIVERAQAGQSDAVIAQAIAYSVWTVRKWRRRERDQGRAALITQRGRPASGALGTASGEIRETIRTMRRGNPGWGAQTILIELGKEDRYAHQHLPSRSRIAAFLKQEGFTRPYERHSELTQPPPTTATAVHEAGHWQIPCLTKL